MLLLLHWSITGARISEVVWRPQRARINEEAVARVAAVVVIRRAAVARIQRRIAVTIVRGW
jgi:hypothetical protein